MDVQSYGQRFTWRGPLIPGYESIFERLDRDLCNANWRS